MGGPLAGILVIEWAMFQNGPGAAYILGDLGAEVIKIEQPGVGDAGRGLLALYGDSMSLPGGRLITFETANRNKRSITVNLRHEKGRDVLFRLARKADVFLTNFSPAVAKRCNADWPILEKVNPRLIYGLTSGFGSKGPDADKRAFDTVAQAYSGLMYTMGDGDSPEPVQAVGAIIDQAAASMLAFGITAALFARHQTGKGQKVETSMLGSSIHLQALAVNTALWRGRAPRRHSRRRPPNPMGNFYQCADGKWLLFGEPQSDRFWGEFCEAIGRPDLQADPRFDSVLKRRVNTELISILDALFATKKRDEWTHIFEQKQCRFVYSPILSMEEVGTLPQAILNRYILEVDHPDMGHIKTTGFPIDFSEASCEIKRPAPQFGQHTEEVLSEIAGYTWEEITQLKDAGAI